MRPSQRISFPRASVEATITQNLTHPRRSLGPAPTYAEIHTHPYNNERDVSFTYLKLARSRGKALMGRGLVPMRQGDFDAAIVLFEESLEVSRTLEDEWWIGLALAQMGVVARRKGDYAKAVALCEESLAIFRTRGGQRGIAYGLRLTGHAVRLQGDLERAIGLYGESLALFGEL